MSNFAQTWKLAERPRAKLRTPKKQSPKGQPYVARLRRKGDQPESEPGRHDMRRDITVECLRCRHVGHITAT
jgi:hypothetical protein